MQSVTVKVFRKLANIWRSYDKNWWHTFHITVHFGKRWQFNKPKWRQRLPSFAGDDPN